MSDALEQRTVLFVYSIGVNKMWGTIIHVIFSTHTCIHTHSHTYIHTHTHTHTYIHTHIHTHTHTYIHTHIHTHTHTHIHTHTHTHTHTQLSRDKKTLEDKLLEVQQALELEENKAKQEHRQRLKLESLIQELEEKLDRESNVIL